MLCGPLACRSGGALHKMNFVQQRLQYYTDITPYPSSPLRTFSPPRLESADRVPFLKQIHIAPCSGSANAKTRTRNPQTTQAASLLLRTGPGNAIESARNPAYSQSDRNSPGCYVVLGGQRCDGCRVQRGTGVGASGGSIGI
jgi:hypothetical protein